MRKITIPLFFLLILSLTACDNIQDQAKKLGFKDVEEMKLLQGKGFKNRNDYVRDLLKDSGCDSEDELIYATGEVNGNCNKLKEIRQKQEAEFKLQEDEKLKLAEAKKNDGINCMADYAASIFVHKGLWDLYVKEHGFNRMNFGAIRIGVIGKTASYLTLVSNKDIGHSPSDNDEIWSRARKTAESNYNGINSFLALDNITKTRTASCAKFIDKEKQEYFFTKVDNEDSEVYPLVPNFMKFPNMP